MMRKGKTLGLALGALAISYGAQALVPDSSSNPYRGIVERNVFDIHAAPPAAVHDPKTDLPPPPTIRLQGITDILGRKQVLFKTQLPAKPPAQPKEESFILTVGEREGQIEVLDINPKQGTVQMKLYGVVTNLSLELNSDKLVNTAPVGGGAVPGAPPLTAPGTLAPPPSLPNSQGGKFPRTLRLPGSNQTANQPGGVSSASGGYGGYNNQTQEQGPQTSPESQMISVEAQRILYQRQGNPLAETLPPLPPGIAKGMGVAQPPPTEQAPQ